MRVCAYILLGMLTWASAIHAAHLEWTPVEGATGYEIEVTRNGGDVLKRRVPADKSSWDAKLPHGVYVFRLRAIDWSGQPGVWSAPAPLISSPPAPEILTPRPKTIIPTADAVQGISLSWKAVPGVSKYRVEVAKPGAVVLTQVTDTNSYVAKGLANGVYAFRVASVIEVVGVLPPGLDKKQWEGDASPWSPFRVGKPDPVALPKPKRDGSEISHTYIALMPVTSFYQLSMTDLSVPAGGDANLISSLNFGLNTELGYAWNEAISLRVKHELLFSKLQDLPLNADGSVQRAVDPSTKTLSCFEFSLGFRPRRASKLEGRVTYSIGTIPMISSGDDSTLSLSPQVLSRVGAGFAAPLFKLFTFNLGIEGGLSAIFSKNLSDGSQSVRNGISFLAMGTAERSLWGKFRIRGFMGFESTYINATRIPTKRDQLFMGGGIEYRFGE